uniref:BH3-interacting domain death agonist n=1 Tax=Amphilophus citrinellus TaxID=61819 RepID=A0A3Q0RZM5_AMPCI
MDRLGVTANEVVFAFLQADNGSIYYNEELHYLGECLKFTADINSNGHKTSALDNGDLETDGHLPSNITVSMQDILPIADLNIQRKLMFVSPFQQWKAHLTSEVERVLRHGVGLEHLPQEKVIIALALTLVKRVCMQAPELLRDLFRVYCLIFYLVRDIMSCHWGRCKIQRTK